VRSIAALALLAAGCGDGKSYLEVVVSADGPLELSALVAQVTNAGEQQTVQVGSGGSFALPPPRSFALAFGAGRSGSVSVDVTALGLDGKEAAHGSGSVVLDAGGTVTLPIDLGGAVDMGPPAVDLGGSDLGALPPCGRMTLLSDDFASSQSGPAWIASTDPGTAVSQGNGQLVIAPASNASGAHFAGYQSASWYDLTGSRVFVEVPTVTDPASGALTSLEINLPNADTRGISEAGGSLYAWNAQNLAVIPYDPTAHRWWQLREQAGTLVFEVSPDGASWTTVASEAPAPPLDLVQVSLTAGTNGPVASPGSAAFASLNGALPATGSWCPIATLSDDFNDGVQAPVWANSYTTGCLIAEMGGTLQMTPPANQSWICDYGSGPSYDLTGGAALIEVLAVTAPSVETWFQVQLDHDDTLGIYELGSVLYAAQTVGGVHTNLRSVPYDPNAHRWWRVREAAGTIYWETSSDSGTWAEITHQTAPFSVTAVAVVFGTVGSPGMANPGTAIFDNLDLLAP
jgi:hypothetical protein